MLLSKLQIVNKHKFTLVILFLLTFFVASANSFFSDAFIRPIISELSFSQIFNGIFLIVFLLYNFFHSSTEYWKFLSPLFLLALFSMLSAIWSPYPVVAIVFSFKLLFIINIFILANSLTWRNQLTEENLGSLAKSIIIITVIGQIAGYILGINAYDSKYSSAGLSDNVSIISAQVLFCLPVMFVGNFKKRGDFIYIFIVLFSILFTLRRSALISLLLVLSVVFLINLLSSSGNRLKKIRWLAIAILICALVAFVMSSTPIGNAVLSRLADLDISDGGTASGRYEFQRLGFIHSIRRDIFSMLFGEGFGASFTVNINNGFKAIGMHSDFLDILIGLGFLGLFFYFWFLKKIWDLIRRFPSGHPYFNALITFFGAIVSLGFFSGGFFEMNTMLGYMCFALIYAKGHE